jgi:hypothetical protein
MNAKSREEYYISPCIGGYLLLPRLYDRRFYCKEAKREISGSNLHSEGKLATSCPLAGAGRHGCGSSVKASPQLYTHPLPDTCNGVTHVQKTPASDSPRRSIIMRSRFSWSTYEHALSSRYGWISIAVGSEYLHLHRADSLVSLIYIRWVLGNRSPGTQLTVSTICSAP